MRGFPPVGASLLDLPLSVAFGADPAGNARTAGATETEFSREEQAWQVQ